MGLDKEVLKCLNSRMSIKHFLQKFSLSGKSERKSPLAREREKFEAEVKEQFQKLKDKGISIPVFTL